VEQQEQAPPGAYDRLPGEHVTIDQVVALNMRHWRRAAGLTQEELGERIGWSAANVSAVERSGAEGRERRRFDADTLTSVALALGVPLLALFLPPVSDGEQHRYLFRARPGGDSLSMADLMALVMPDSDDDTPVMGAYRERLRAAVTRYLDPSWAEDVARWLTAAAEPQVRADRAERLRSERAMLLQVAAELGNLADAIGTAGGER